MDILPECVHIHNMDACRGQKPLGPTELELQSYKLPQGCWDLNVGLLKEQQVTPDPSVYLFSTKI